MAEMDTEKLLVDAIRDGMREGIKSRLSNQYSNNPLEKLITDVIAKRGDEFRSMLDEALSACMKDKEFRKQISEAVRHTLAKTLVARFGGELEKQINVLKSDPTTRAKITLAIEEIVKSKTEL